MPSLPTVLFLTECTVKIVGMLPLHRLVETGDIPMSHQETLTLGSLVSTLDLPSPSSWGGERREGGGNMAYTALWGFRA